MAIARKPPVKASAPAPAPVAKPAIVAAPIMPSISEPALSVPETPAPKQIEAIVESTTHQAMANGQDLQEHFRKAVENSVEQSRAAYEKFKATAEEANSTLESTYAAASKGLSALNAKAIDAMKAQADATFDHVKALMSAKSMSEALALQSTHARKLFESFTAQTKDLAELAQKVAADSAEPIKATLTKRFAA